MGLMTFKVSEEEVVELDEYFMECNNQLNDKRRTMITFSNPAHGDKFKTRGMLGMRKCKS